MTNSKIEINCIASDNLLDEFIIKEFDGNYAVFATDRAYSLLGHKDKEKFATNGKYTIDTMSSKYYLLALVYFLKNNNYHIDCLIRTSSGNTHDASWDSEVLIFNNAGLWSDKLDKFKSYGVAWASTPVVKYFDEINDKLIENWCEIYDLTGNGEDSRYIYCSLGSKKYCYSFEISYIRGTANSRKSKKSGCYTGANIYLKQVKK